jgi:hypothetical protein
LGGRDCFGGVCRRRTDHRLARGFTYPSNSPPRCAAGVTSSASPPRDCSPESYFPCSWNATRPRLRCFSGRCLSWSGSGPASHCCSVARRSAISRLSPRVSGSRPDAGIAIRSSRSHARVPRVNPGRRQAQERALPPVCDAVGGGMSADKTSLQFFNVWCGARLQSLPTVVDLIMTTPLG